MTATVTILPETDDTTLCLRLNGIVTKEDYLKYFEEPLNRILEKNDHYSLLALHAADFQGWTEEAADLSFKCISTVGAKARKAAYVNAPDSRMLMMKMLKPLMTAEVRYFDEDAYDEALRWVKE